MVEELPEPQGFETQAWAEYYRRYATRFARSVAPRIRSFYESTVGPDAKRSVLDVCCGQGTLAEHFLDHGYRVTGIDLSEPMLEIARINLHDYLATGQAQLIHADASEFSVDERFGLCTATFESLNLLPTPSALERCFECVRACAADDALFVFDLLTDEGFRSDYNSVVVTDIEDAVYVFRGVYDGHLRAHARLTGFIRQTGGHWSRFDELLAPTRFPVDQVFTFLQNSGWRQSWMASLEDLSQPLARSEGQDRVFFLARP